MLPKLNDYKDLMIKLDHDMKRLQETNHIYELLDCLLTLNALPEWIVESETANESLKLIAKNKVKIMKGFDGFVFNENILSGEINQMLRFIRLICNHAKHKTNSKEIPIIQSIPGTAFPILLPARFCIIIAIGNLRVDGEFLVYQVSEFWKKQIINNRC